MGVINDPNLKMWSETKEKVSYFGNSGQTGGSLWQGCLTTSPTEPSSLVRESGTLLWKLFAKFSAVQTKGSVFSEQSMFVKKMDVEGDVEAVGNLHDTEWAKCAKQAQQRVVSSLNCYFVNFTEFHVS